MEKLKVKVNSAEESKEVQELFFELGFGWHCGDIKEYMNLDMPYIYLYPKFKGITCGSVECNFINHENKEITLQQLKDMVVLRRNDVNDKTHLYYGAAILKQGDKNYAFHSGKGWFLSNISDENLKEISKTKEYLEPHPNGKYVFVESEEKLHPSWIEIPEEAEWVKLWNNGEKDECIEFYRGKNEYFSITEKVWMRGMDQSTNKIGQPATIVWQRNAQDEDFLNIPSVDVDASNISFSNPIVETKEKHSHYKKDISHLNILDPYRISELYGLHSCADHIMKKSLCAGGRGHKDLLTDIQNIIDTAERWKQMVLEDANSSED